MTKTKEHSKKVQGQLITSVRGVDKLSKREYNAFTDELIRESVTYKRKKHPHKFLTLVSGVASSNSIHVMLNSEAKLKPLIVYSLYRATHSVLREGVGTNIKNLLDAPIGTFTDAVYNVKEVVSFIDDLIDSHDEAQEKHQAGDEDINIIEDVLVFDTRVYDNDLITSGIEASIAIQKAIAKRVDKLSCMNTEIILIVPGCKEGDYDPVVAGVLSELKPFTNPGIFTSLSNKGHFTISNVVLGTYTSCMIDTGVHVDKPESCVGNVFLKEKKPSLIDRIKRFINSVPLINHHMTNEQNGGVVRVEETNRIGKTGE